MRLTFESLNTWDLFFLFPGRVYLFFGHWTTNRQRTLPGKSPLSVLQPPAFILNFACECQYFFLEFFLERLASPNAVELRRCKYWIAKLVYTASPLRC